MTLQASSQVQEARSSGDFHRAVQLHLAGRAEEAIVIYHEMLQHEPTNGFVMSNLALAYSRLGQLDRAIRCYRLSLNLLPDDPGIRFNLAGALYRKGRFADAVTELKKVLSSSVSSVPLRKATTTLLAGCYFRLRDLDSAAKLLRELMEKHESDRSLRFFLAVVLLDQGDYIHAWQLVDPLRRAGDSVDARLALGAMALTSRKYASAIDELARAASLDPGRTDVHRLYGQALFDKGDIDQAFDEFSRALARSPDDVESNYYAGLILRQRYDYAGALRRFTQARNSSHGDMQIEYQLASLYVAMGRAPDALPILEALVKRDPEFVEGHVSLALVYYKLHRKADGDRERRHIDRLTAAAQALAVAAHEVASQDDANTQP